MVTRLCELPVHISLGVYSVDRPANPQPIAYLARQAASIWTYMLVTLQLVG